MSDHANAILKTLAYFDVFDYPLTPLETWQWLYAEDTLPRDISLRDIMIGLDELRTAGRVGTKHGFYFLTDRDTIVYTRMDRYRQAEYKYHRALQFIRWFRFVPFVRMIAVCNTLAYSNSRSEADIDLFIVTSPGRVWQARFWIAGILKLLNMRPTAERTRDTLCASFFTDTEHLRLESLALPQDIYLPYWVVQVVPILDENIYERFIEENRWVRQRVPFAIPVMPPRRRRVAPRRSAQRLIEAITFFIPERVFKNYQQRVMPERLRHLANHDTRVVITDSMLKFHDTDRRQQYLDAWRRRMRTLQLPSNNYSNHFLNS